MDVEFLTQFLQMTHGRRIAGSLRSPTTCLALRAMAKIGVGPERLAEIEPIYQWLMRTSARLGLIYDRSGDRAAYTPEEIVAADLPDIGSDPLDDLDKALDTVGMVYDEVFGRRGDHAD